LQIICREAEAEDMDAAYKTNYLVKLDGLSELQENLTV